MSRWQPDARQRLEEAALALFVEQGFAATTVPEITARAGLTTRTFFRHFADKREVIFAGDEIPELARRLLAEAPAAVPPATLIVQGLCTVAESRFEGRREEYRRRRAIVASDDGLQERDLRKRAALAAAIRSGLADRGVDPREGALLAETTVTVLQLALERWLDADDRRPLVAVVLDSFRALQSALEPFPAATAALDRRLRTGRPSGHDDL